MHTTNPGQVRNTRRFNENRDAIRLDNADIRHERLNPGNEWPILLFLFPAYCGLGQNRAGQDRVRQGKGDPVPSPVGPIQRPSFHGKEETSEQTIELQPSPV